MFFWVICVLFDHYTLYLCFFDIPFILCLSFYSFYSEKNGFAQKKRASVQMGCVSCQVLVSSSRCRKPSFLSFYTICTKESSSVHLLESPGVNVCRYLRWKLLKEGENEKDEGMRRKSLLSGYLINGNIETESSSLNLEIVGVWLSLIFY